MFIFFEQFDVVETLLIIFFDSLFPREELTLVSGDPDVVIFCSGV